ncbi:hypothetical protein F4680DRAFT_467770 [Xylaria scruposa]|nr:hypothetical protein F4680DRAFT_467770 [Xylaria scruposa]
MALETLASSLINDLVRDHSALSNGILLACPEFSSIVSTLLESGFTCVDLGLPNIKIIQETLQAAFNLNGTDGCESLELGTENTAKAIIALGQLGIFIRPSQLVEKYNNDVHSKMSSCGRDMSFTTISHILTVMCASSAPQTYAREIEMATKDLCDVWRRDPNNINQPNESGYCSMMQISKALKSVLNAWGQELLPGFNLQLVRDAILVIFQFLVRLLKSQEQDGSWGGQRENTAYALITINEIASLSIVQPINYQVKDTIRKGREFLFTTPGCRPCPGPLWTQKVADEPSCLSQAFTLAALKYSIGEASCSIQKLLPGDLHTILRPLKLFAQLPMFSNTPGWCIAAWLIEGALFQHALGKLCLDACPKNEKKKEKYLSVIPFTWAASNNMHGCPLGSDMMLEMMAICALAYQIDDFIESKVACLPSSALSMIRMSIPEIFREVEIEEFNTTTKYEQSHDNHINGSTQQLECSPQIAASILSPPASPQPSDPFKVSLGRIKRDLKGIIRRLLQAPYVRTATPHSRIQLRITLVDYITAHIIQTEQSVGLAAQTREEKGNHKTLVNPPSSLLTWVRTVSGDHTIGPYAVAAFCCMYGNGTDLVYSPQANYILQDVARHLAALCRLYNDYGSIARDRDEDNLNSINFPEFQGIIDERSVKENLKIIAEYERRCLHASIAELRPLVTKSLFAALTVFCETAEIYNQMYVLKDFTAEFNEQ